MRNENVVITPGMNWAMRNPNVAFEKKSFIPSSGMGALHEQDVQSQE
jgi:hypothetical protein